MESQLIPQELSAMRATIKRNWFKATLAVMAFVVAMALIGAFTQDNKESIKESIPACEYEDGSTQDTCYWDASKHGNGKGQSFISHNYGEHITYLR